MPHRHNFPIKFHSSGWLTLDAVEYGIRSLAFFCDQKYLNKKWGGAALSTRITSEAHFILLPSLKVHDELC
jgi:hypothetical protein